MILLTSILNQIKIKSAPSLFFNSTPNTSKLNQKNIRINSIKNNKILVLGDFHIPKRAKNISPIIDKYFKKQNYSIILCTGDLTAKEILDYLSKLGKFYVVKGNMDLIDLPEKIIMNINDIKIGLVHGSDVYPRGDTTKLFNLAKKLNVNILISGHTHSSFIQKIDKIILLNPGSITGSWGGGNYSGIPEFIEIKNIKSNKLTIKLKKMINQEIIEENYEIEL
jgi:putative phosphoesterase